MKNGIGVYNFYKQYIDHFCIQATRPRSLSRISLTSDPFSIHSNERDFVHSLETLRDFHTPRDFAYFIVQAN